MGNTTGITIFIFQALLALFAFFVTAPMTLNAISLFGVQKRFADYLLFSLHGPDGLLLRRRAAHGRLLEIPQHP